MSRNQTYTAPAIVLHWLGALLVTGAFGLGWIMTDMAGLSPAKLRYFSWHKWLGVTLLLTWLPRVAWRLMRRAPPLPAGMSSSQRRLAHLAHLMLYALLLALPASGLLYSQAAGVPVSYLGMLALPTLIEPDPAWKAGLKSLHWWLGIALAALVAAHVLAALKHQFIDKDNLLARMLPFLKRRS